MIRNDDAVGIDAVFGTTTSPTDEYIRLTEK